MIMKIVITTTGDREKAEQMARDLLNSGLSPCVNIIDSVTSIYFWNNQINRDKENILLIKTERPEMVRDFIEKNHNYDVPEIIFVNGEIPPSKYRSWFQEYFENFKS